jgi:predicted secreted protein
MTKLAGRKIEIYKGTGISRARVAGARADSINFNNGAIDITDKASDGWQTLLNDASVRSVGMTVEGLLDGPSLIAAALGDTTDLIDDYEIDIDGIGIVSGEFHFSSLQTGAPHDDAATFTATIASSGEITFTAAAAPTNTILPSISGTVQEGQILTAFPGVWTGSPSFTYQWQQDAAGNGTFANITGATSQAYVPVTGNVGNALRVVVTGTNSAGTATATSAATVVVAGA